MKSMFSLANKISTASSIKEIDSTAYDIAFEFNAKSHALIEIEYDCNQDLPTSSIKLVSSRLRLEDQLRLIDKQQSNLSGIARDPAMQLVPHLWNDAAGRWSRLEFFNVVDDVSISEYPSIATLGLFVGLGPNRIIGFILIDALLGFDRNQLMIFNGVASSLIAQFIDTKSAVPSSLLNKNEHSCLVWCASGKTSSEIGKILSLSEHTVNHYFNIICAKLQAVNRVHAVAMAIKMGLIGLDEIS